MSTEPGVAAPVISPVPSGVGSPVSRIPTAPVAAASLVAGYLTARFTRRRPLGGVVLAAAGTWCTRRWAASAGAGPAAALLGVYAGAFALSHPLAKRIGAWPSVLCVAAASGTAAWVVADRRRMS